VNCNVTTIDPMVQDGPPEQSPASARPSRRPRRLIALAAVIAILVAGYIVAVHKTSNLYAEAPGSASPVAPLITVKGPTKTYTHPGQILFVTVSLRSVGPFNYIFDKLNHDVTMVTQRQLLGSAKPSQLNQVDAIQMQTSTQTAVIVALRRLGYTVTVTNVGAQVLEVEANSPADGHLVPGDLITAFDGVPTPTAQALVGDIHAHRPGDVVTLTVQPPSGPSKVEAIKLGNFPPPLLGRGSPPSYGFLGISTGTKQVANLPVDVTIDPGNVGGPSAGLAFTLGVINALSSGDITGGRKVAVTGTIDGDGNVGDVGGVPQKTVAVRNSGAVAFLVPKVEYKAALKKAGSRLKVIPVTTLDEALNALGSLGGDLQAVPPAPTSTPTTAPQA
jgi:PDZ domain-containing protein